MNLSNQFAIEIEISDEYNSDEHQLLIDVTNKTLDTIDNFLDGRTRDIFKGLRIKIGENVAKGGGEAISTQNTIALNGRPMLMSIAKMRHVAGYLPKELTDSSIGENEQGGALRYTLAHEMGHILDELTESGHKMHRIAAKESPTKYGREADEWNTEKDHEAFAEGFAHMVYGMQVSETLAKAIDETIQAKIAEISKTH